jgi:competence protein ComEC
VFFAAALMLFFNPLLLALDAGFQLSFLAMLGLIYVSPVLSKLLNNVPDIFQIKYALVATLSAQALTLPVIIYNFGRIPILSPIVNIMITPLLSLVTILGFFSVFCGIFSQILGQIIGFPVYLMLSYILGAVDFFSRINFSSFSLKISWPWLVFSYFIVFILIWQTRRKLTQKSFL